MFGAFIMGDVAGIWAPIAGVGCDIIDDWGATEAGIPGVPPGCIGEIGLDDGADPNTSKRSFDELAGAVEVGMGVDDGCSAAGGMGAVPGEVGELAVFI